MEEKLKFGTSTNNLLLSGQDTIINPGILKTQETHKTCRSGAQIQDGGKCSSLRRTNSSTGRAARSLMSKEAKTKKDKQLVFLETMEEKDSNGKLFILTRLMVHKPKELIKTLASTLTDHSTSSLNFHSVEWQSASELTMLL
jgi:hypothetical protein